MVPVRSADKSSEVNSYREESITVYKNGDKRFACEAIIVEEPLSICIDGALYSMVMRSPGDEKAHAAGFCLTEGIIDHSNDLLAIDVSKENGVNTAAVALSPRRRQKIGHILNRKGSIDQTNCGICGKELTEDIRRILTPTNSQTAFTIEEIHQCVQMLPESQLLYQKTRSSHAAMIFDEALNPLSFAEDVGRHNALDKAIGRVVLEDKIPAAVLGIMSSRLSYELVQKAARAQIEILIGISRPTTLALDLARSINMTLGCSKNNRLMIFCCENRIIGE